ncbi:hypothetical protein [Leptospira licerasiae]|uniref:Uncharacterized protein n=1 Tax=Leptospira licerasiae str. MMD4847 TaxID=1049971 RepID=A0ABN0HEB7_9LEPT|nr:hypothetical protein [Leptospira licerasiae]EIE01109.1 hypothetical protein LEP1GSC185_3862 [Leptospira licerasiae serovar Varillal str. VAR 010]EJZ43781.1 hypothetical protein LEP1GSC178_2029 [Leptospira licerasiae str. MMD4847]
MSLALQGKSRAKSCGLAERRQALDVSRHSDEKFMIILEKMNKGDEVIITSLLGHISQRFFFGYVSPTLSNPFQSFQAIFAKNLEACNRYEDTDTFWKAYGNEDFIYINDNFEFLDMPGLSYVHLYKKCIERKINRNFRIHNRNFSKIKKWETKGRLFDTNSSRIDFDLKFSRLAAQGISFYLIRLHIYLLRLRLKWFFSPFLVTYYFIVDNFIIGFSKFKDYRTKLLDYQEILNDKELAKLISGGKDYKEQLASAHKELEVARDAYIEMNKVVIGLLIAVITILINLLVSSSEHITKERELITANEKIRKLEQTEISKSLQINNLLTKIEVLEMKLFLKR